MLLVGDAVGIPGCRVPYIKRGFTVTGLPKDIQVKKPSSYGVDQIKAIMAHQEKCYNSAGIIPQACSCLLGNTGIFIDKTVLSIVPSAVKSCV